MRVWLYYRLSRDEDKKQDAEEYVFEELLPREILPLCDPVSTPQDRQSHTGVDAGPLTGGAQSETDPG